MLTVFQDEDGVTFEGSRYLLEYELVGETLTEEMEGRFSLMQVRVGDGLRLLHVYLC